INPNNIESKKVNSIYESISPQIMNKLNVDNEYIERIQQGFYNAFNDPTGTGYSYWNDEKYDPAGKTGTAENEVYEQLPDGSYKQVSSTKNLSLVGYAPYDDPEIAFALIVPNLDEDSESKINHRIGRKVMDLYFEKN